MFWIKRNRSCSWPAFTVETPWPFAIFSLQGPYPQQSGLHNSTVSALCWVNSRDSSDRWFKGLTHDWTKGDWNVSKDVERGFAWRTMGDWLKLYRGPLCVLRIKTLELFFIFSYRQRLLLSSNQFCKDVNPRASGQQTIRCSVEAGDSRALP